MLDVPTVRVATGRSALGDLAGRGGGTGGALTGGEPVTVLGAGFKNAGAALIRGGGFGLRVERSRLDTRLTDLDTRLTDLDRPVSRSLEGITPQRRHTVLALLALSPAIIALFFVAFVEITPTCTSPILGFF